MKTYGLNSAEYIKCQFIDFLLSKDEDLIIGNELMYGTERRLVDLVVLHNRRITAIEVKSDNDNLKRIYEQIAEYKKIFNYVIIVTTPKYQDRILNIVSKDIGIYTIKQDLSIVKIRPPHLQKKRIKIEMLYSINSTYLRKKGNYSSKKYNADNIRLLYARKRISYIQEILFEYWNSKFKEKFNLFLSERGKQTHIEDLSVLSSPNQIE